MDSVLKLPLNGSRRPLELHLQGIGAELQTDIFVRINSKSEVQVETYPPVQHVLSVSAQIVIKVGPEVSPNWRNFRLKRALNFKPQFSRLGSRSSVFSATEFEVTKKSVTSGCRGASVGFRLE